MPFLLPSVPPLDRGAEAAARSRQDQLTKPQGSLGRLEELSIQLAAISGKPRPSVARKAVIVMAADHGVTVEGVSAYPGEVTPQMVLNFLQGGAAINVLARLARAGVVIVDMGVATDLPPHPGLVQRKVLHGTRNLARGPAMTRSEAEECIMIGIETLRVEAEKGLDLVATGDMGIGNTTPSSAITAVVTRMPAAQVTGRGTGLSDAGLAGKVVVIERALAVNRPNPEDLLDVLSKVGGLEIGGLAGVIIGAAARRIPVVLDGFISGAAALIAAGLVPEVKPYLIASHRSVEIGHRAILEHLGLIPILDLGLRLGEGTGAVLAFSILEAATSTLNEMATYADARVSEKSQG